MLFVPRSYIFRSPRFLVPFSFNESEAEIALTSRHCNVATLRRPDVETSQRWTLVDFLFSLTQRWDFATLRRRDVPASFMLFFSLLQNGPKNCPFYMLFTQNARIRYRTIKCIFNCKIKLKQKNRRGYVMSALGTHHTPKLSFLLVPKQKLTLNRTHNLHTIT